MYAGFVCLSGLAGPPANLYRSHHRSADWFLFRYADCLGRTSYQRLQPGTPALCLANWPESWVVYVRFVAALAAGHFGRSTSPGCCVGGGGSDQRAFSDSFIGDFEFTGRKPLAV